MSGLPVLQQESTIGETQWLVSQILHDFISHFTAISTGLDLPIHMATEIFPILLQSRQQINAYLNVMRFLFSQGDGQDLQGPEKIIDYGNTMGVSINIGFPTHHKIMTGLTLWAIKRIFVRNQTDIRWEDRLLYVRSPSLAMQVPEIQVLLGHTQCHNVKDSFSAYLARLIHQKKMFLEVSYPSSKELLFCLKDISA